MPKINIGSVPVRKGCGYPPPFDAPCADRTRRRLGEAGGLRDFGANLMTLPPGGWSTLSTPIRMENSTLMKIAENAVTKTSAAS